MINVKNGTTVVGDGNHDDTAGLQNFINAAGGALYFPPGKYRITGTLLFPNKTGYHLVGCGMAQRAACDTKTQETTNRGTRAAIVWDGQAGGTMVEYNGRGLIWDGLTLWGSYATDPKETGCATPTARAGTGIRICSDCPPL